MTTGCVVGSSPSLRWVSPARHHVCVFDVFVNYRTVDERFGAAYAHDALARRFGRDRIFLDHVSIAPGERYASRLRDALEQAQVLVVLVGPEWLADEPGTGVRLIDREDDWVRKEIRRALEREIKIIPVLLDGTAMPGAHALPSDIRGLVTRQAVEVRHRSLQSDLARLGDAVARWVGERRDALDERPEASPVGDEKWLNIVDRVSRRSPWRLHLSRWVLFVVICLAAVIAVSDAVSGPASIRNSDIGATKPARDRPTTEPTVGTSKPKPKPKPTGSKPEGETTEPGLPGPAPGVIDPDPANPDSKIAAVRLTETLRESHAIPPDARLETERPLAGDVPSGLSLEFAIERSMFSAEAWIETGLGTGTIRIEANWKGGKSDPRNCDPTTYSCSEETSADGTTFKYFNDKYVTNSKSQAVLVTAPSGAQAYVFQGSSLEDGSALPLSAERLLSVGVVVARGLEDR